MDEFERIYNEIYGGDNSAQSTVEEAEDAVPEAVAEFEEPVFEAEPSYEYGYQEEPAEYPESSEIVQDEEYHFDSRDYFEEDEYEDYDDYDDFASKSFKDYISSRIAGIALKLRGNVPADVASQTVQVDEDELGEEIPLINAQKYYGSQIYSLRLRFRLSVFFFAILVYISVGGPLPGLMKNLQIATAACLAIQLSLIVFALDVFTNGIMNIFRGRLGADSLAAISCLLTVIDAVMSLKGLAPEHMPFCAVSSFSLLGILLSSLLSARGIRKALRVPAIGKLTYAVTAEEGVTGGSVTLLKSLRNTSGFLRRTEEEPLDEMLFRKSSLIILIFAGVLSAAVAYLKSSVDSFLYILTIILSPAVPFTALLCYALPFFIGSSRIFSNGAALAGWSGLVDIGHSKNLIVTDRDLFPPESIEIQNVRIFADYDSDKVISYAAMMIEKSGCCLAPAFEALLEENGCEKYRVDNFVPLSGGGLKGMIEGHNILCGSTDIMRLMDVRIPSKLVDGPCVLLAIDGVLFGIFNIKYRPDAKVRRALVSLMRSNRHPIFAVRDFNVTPDLIHDCFDVATDGYDFPPYVERYPLSEAKPSGDSQIAGVVCREGLGPLTALADTGRSIFVTVRMSTILTLISVPLGMILAAIRLWLGGNLGVPVMLIYMAIAALPALILGLIGTSYD